MERKVVYILFASLIFCITSAVFFGENFETSQDQPRTGDVGDYSYLFEWGSYGFGDSQFSSPMGICVNSTGYVYVMDAGTVKIFSQTGEFISSINLGAGTGSICINDSDYLYASIVLDTRVYSPSGEYIQFFQNNDHVNANAIDHYGTFFSTLSSNHEIGVWSQTGELLPRFGASQLSSPWGIALSNQSGKIFVTDDYNNQINVFDNKGIFLQTIGSAGTADGQFSSPKGITLNALGYVFVADSNNHRIQIFDKNGIFIGKWGSFGSEAGQFNKPWAITVNQTGHIYVFDYNYRVQVFGPASPSPPPFDYIYLILIFVAIGVSIFLFGYFYRGRIRSPSSRAKAFPKLGGESPKEIPEIPYKNASLTILRQSENIGG